MSNADAVTEVAVHNQEVLIIVKIKALVVLFAVMLMAAAALAQIDPMLGSHNVGQEGCGSCHAPHNALPGQGAYLWANAIPTGTYNTYLTSTGQGGAGALNAGLMTAGLTNATQTLANLPMAHTVLCLSCHDTAFNTGMAASIPGSTTKYSNFNVGTGGNLSGDHPVNVVYPTTDPMYFGVTAATGAFTDTAFAYGHPGRLYSDGVNAYVECSTCHNPHAQTAAVVTIAGSKVSVATTHFIRGQYRATNETAANHATIPGPAPTSANYTTDNANFCMSCHSYPSGGFTGSVH